MESALRALIDLLRENGAELNPAAVIIAEKGQLRIESSLGRESKETIVCLPESCLLNQKHFDLAIEHGHFVIKSATKEATPVQVKLQELMLEIYNLSGKVSREREASIALNYDKNDPLMTQLFSVRPGPLRALEEWKASGSDANELLLKTFLKTRTLKLKYGNTQNIVLMPVIDYFNHHPAAGGFHRSDAPEDNKQYLSVCNAKLAEESAECFVSYGQYDHMDLFLSYNFFEPSLPIYFLRSVPFELDFGEHGQLVIGSLPARGAWKQLPQKIADLEAWLPAILEKREGHLHVSHLKIPATISPMALRRTLNVLLRTLNADVDLETGRKLVIEAKGQLLQANTDFYSRLRSDAKSSHNSPFRDTVFALCETQLNLIKRYETGIETVLATHQKQTG